MIRINVFIKVEEKNRPTVLDASKKLTEGSIKEDGCIAYDIFESATRPDVLMICETWKDSDALESHQTTTHFTENISTLKELCEIKIEKFDF